ncbi:MAG: peptide ABC transporter permease, partial [Alphaproteobacteria bacterium]
MTFASARAETITRAAAVQGRSLWEDARRRLMRNRAAVTGMIVLGLLVVAA